MNNILLKSTVLSETVNKVLISGYKELNLEPLHVHILKLINECSSICKQSIADRINVDVSLITKAIKELMSMEDALLQSKEKESSFELTSYAPAVLKNIADCEVKIHKDFFANIDENSLNELSELISFLSDVK
jgi:predicted transcriptional regulator